jgi:hypothetical protein
VNGERLTDQRGFSGLARTGHHLDETARLGEPARQDVRGAASEGPARRFTHDVE